MRRVLIFLARTAALLALAGLFVGCDRREQLHIFNWAVYTPQSVIEAFEREYGVRVIYTEFASNEEMLARLMAGGGRGFDIVFPSGDYVAIMARLGMLHRLDHSLMPNLANIDPAVLAKAIYDPIMQYSVPYFFGAAGVIVNTAMVSEFPRDISIFSRADLAGRMTMLDDPRQVIGDALNYLGFSVNTRNPAEISAARDHINAYWRPNLVTFNSEIIGTGFANGDFWVVQTWAENVFLEIADNPQMLANAYFFIPPGGSSYTDNMVILREAQNVELAHKFINFIHRPDIYAMFVDEFGLPATVNIPARQYTQVIPWYAVEDMEATGEIQNDVGTAMTYFTDAWFSIRVGN
ncbi:MAG: extracellular solute-binding protein [Treponema sp.]|nr:extracellular solute-binding protein [Treponema sp.]